VRSFPLQLLHLSSLLLNKFGNACLFVCYIKYSIYFSNKITLL